jgi:transposase
VHAVLATFGIPVTCSDLFGAWGTAWLDELGLPQPYAGKVALLRQLPAWLSGEISMLDAVIADLPGHYPPYRAVQQLPGIAPVLAAVIVAEIGDISRFSCPARLCSWAGLTPRHREPDLKVARGHITKQASPILRWALVEAIQHQPAGSPPGELKDRIIARRGSQARNIAKAAAARKLLTCVFNALHDGRSGHWPPAAARRRPGEQARTRAARDRRLVWPPPPAARPDDGRSPGVLGCWGLSLGPRS